MENDKLMLKISRLLSSSFASCRFRALPDVIANNHDIIIPHENDSSPLIKIPESPTGKKEAALINVCNRSSSSHSAWFSSADEKFPPENDAFLSFSSCSGDYFSRRTAGTRCDQKITKNINELGDGSSRRGPPHRTETRERNDRDLGCDQMSARMYYSGRRVARGHRRGIPRRRFCGVAAVGECLAVEKRSRDPRGDFMASMVDVIAAKQLFGVADLERLLICFLSLNSVSHHGMIFEVFSEICETLFNF